MAHIKTAFSTGSNSRCRLTAGAQQALSPPCVQYERLDDPYAMCSDGSESSNELVCRQLITPGTSFIKRSNQQHRPDCSRPLRASQVLSFRLEKQSSLSPERKRITFSYKNQRTTIRPLKQPLELLSALVILFCLVNTSLHCPTPFSSRSPSFLPSSPLFSLSLPSSP